VPSECPEEARYYLLRGLVDYYPSILEQAFALALLVFILGTAVVSIRAYMQRRTISPACAARRCSAPAFAAGTSRISRQLRNSLCAGVWRRRTCRTRQLVGSVLVTVCYACGMVFTAGWLLLCTGNARHHRWPRGAGARREVVPAGRSWTRWSIATADSLAYLGLAIFFRSSWMLWVVLFAFLGTLMVSYVRARAEALGAECKVGLLQRPERLRHSGLRVRFRCAGRAHDALAPRATLLVGDSDRRGSPPRSAMRRPCNAWCMFWACWGSVPMPDPAPPELVSRAKRVIGMFVAMVGSGIALESAAVWTGRGSCWLVSG